MRRYFTTLCLALWAGGAAAQDCSEIIFEPGTSSGEVSGQVINGQPMCFIFGSGAGQTARLQLFGSDDTCFTVPDVIDCQADFSFPTQPRNYTVNVFQFLRSATSEEFTLRLTIH
ncbi:hypothetical protein [Roseibium marinum]|nr:hypothetical protein [Roseibium marinum]